MFILSEYAQVAAEAFGISVVAYGRVNNLYLPFLKPVKPGPPIVMQLLDNEHFLLIELHPEIQCQLPSLLYIQEIYEKYFFDMGLKYMKIIENQK